MVLNTFKLLIRNAEIWKGHSFLFEIVHEGMIVKITGLVPVESVPNQYEEYKHANQMCPHIYSFIMNHEQTFNQLPVSVEVYSIALLNMSIMAHVLRSFNICPYEVGLISHIDIINLTVFSS